MDRNLALDFVRATEAAAMSSARWMGRGDNKAADQAAVEAMRMVFSTIPIRGRVVIGEGERDEAPMLYIGEEVGSGNGPEIDIAVDPLEGTNITAKGGYNSISVLAASLKGNLLHAPDTYMDKIACGPGYPPGIIDLDASPADNVRALAKAKGVEPAEITVCVLDRPRHAEIIGSLREVGARVYLIGDGDIAGVINTADPTTGIDLYLGSGGAPEGVLACAALKAQGAKRALPLPVSAPFHSSLMKPAALKLKEKLQATVFASPHIAVVNNIDVAVEQDADRIRDALFRQALGPVRWVECVQALGARAAHVALYALMIAMPLVGWAMQGAAGTPVVLPGGIEIELPDRV